MRALVFLGVAVFAAWVGSKPMGNPWLSFGALIGVCIGGAALLVRPK